MKYRRLSHATTICSLSFILGGCTHMSVSDCPAPKDWYNPFSVLGHDVPRVRSAKYRMALGDVPSAATRFAPYALMSAYAYFDKEGCPGTTQSAAEIERIRAEAITVRETLTNFDRAKPFTPVEELEGNHGCEDRFGLMYRVWHSPDRNELVIAFRGTSDARDWWYGNLWPLSRGLTEKTQYSEVQRHVRNVLDKVKATPNLSGAKVIVTGHSLGGGLAQHALYSYPKEIHQAVVFDPSIITGYTAIDGAERVALCNCSRDLGAEAPIIRVYESNEILSNLRIFHKIFYPAHLHIQEVRFNYDSSTFGTHSHNMARLATALAGDAIRPPQEAHADWFASSVAKCTKLFKKAQEQKCKQASTAAMCTAS